MHLSYKLHKLKKNYLCDFNVIKMKTTLFFGFFLLLVNSYGQGNFKNKIYIQQDSFFISSNLLAFQAIAYRNNINNPITSSEKKILYISLSPVMKHRIKYSIVPTQEFLGFSHSSFYKKGWYTHAKTISFPLYNLRNTTNPICAYYIKSGADTAPYLSTTTAIKEDPLDNLYLPRRRHPPVKDIRIDFASGDKYFYYSAIIEKELKVFSYKIPSNKFEGLNKKNWQIGNKEYDVIPVEKKRSYKLDIEEDFYTFFIRNQLYLLTINGQLFLLTRNNSKKIRFQKRAKKLNQLSIHLGDDALIIDKDQQAVYTINKSKLNIILPFNKIVEKYASQIDLK